jgi:predicted  nucleic acid-binding Zn-ribbon protein
MSKRDEYVEKLKHKLDDWNKDLDELEAKAEHVKGDMKEKYKEELAVVREQRESVKQKASELIDSSEGAWEELKTGVEDAWHKLSAAIDRAHSKF